MKNDPMLEIDSDLSMETEPWTGSLTDLLANNHDVPEFCVRRMEQLRLDEKISFKFATESWRIRRVA